jgi:hypothetical protein
MSGKIKGVTPRGMSNRRRHIEQYMDAVREKRDTTAASTAARVGSTNPGEDDPTVVGATEKVKRKASRLAGKLARRAVSQGNEWILFEVGEEIKEAVLETAESAIFLLDVENLGPATGPVRFRIFGFI